MATILDIPPGHPLRDRRWRPPNPDGTAEETIAKVRQALWRIDPKLDVWWYKWWRPDDKEHPGRWAVMYWLERGQCWSVVRYWEGPAGEYRPLSMDAVQRIINELAECEVEANVAAQRCEAENAARRKKEMETRKEALREYTEDFAARDQGVRGVFAPGYIRRRFVQPSDILNTNHKRFIRENRLEG